MTEREAILAPSNVLDLGPKLARKKELETPVAPGDKLATVIKLDEERKKRRPRIDLEQIPYLKTDDVHKKAPINSIAPRDWKTLDGTPIFTPLEK